MQAPCGLDKERVRSETLGKFPNCEEADIAFWGVLDGDERVKSAQGNVLFLPGDGPLEDLMLGLLGRIDGRDLGLSESLYDEAMRLSEGVESHDRIDQVSRPPSGPNDECFSLTNSHAVDLDR